MKIGILLGTQSCRELQMHGAYKDGCICSNFNFNFNFNFSKCIVFVVTHNVVPGRRGTACIVQRVIGGSSL